MIKTAVTGVVTKTKRKRKRSAEGDDSDTTPTKVARIVKEKKSTSKNCHNSDSFNVKHSGAKSSHQHDKKLQQTQNNMQTDGRRKKPKMIHHAEGNKLKMTTKGEKNEKKTMDGKKKMKMDGKNASGITVTTEVTGVVSKTKGKRQGQVEDHDSVRTLSAKGPTHKTGSNVQQHGGPEGSHKHDKKWKKTQNIITGTDGKKKKPKMVHCAEENKLKMTTEGEENEKKMKDGKKRVKDSGKSASGDDAEAKKPKTQHVKLELMKKSERKKLRKMKSAKFELATKVKTLWEECRRSDLKQGKKEAHVAELFKLVQGHAKSLIFAHDTSRVVQTLMKRGTPQMRDAVFQELRDHLIDIMKCKYSKFFIKKIFTYGLKVHRDFIFTAMQGKLRKLLRHREAVTVVEYAYNYYANASQRAAMAADFYGKTFAVFRAPEEKTLQVFVQSHPDKRNEVIRSMKQSLAPLVDKSVVQHSFVHRLYYDFFTCADDPERSEMIEVVREHVVHMLHTHDGARVAMMCLWHGTAKDRKVIVKSMKTYIVKVAKEEFGHMVLLAAFDVIDDTKFVQKVILDELLGSLNEVIDDKFGRKVLLYLLHPRVSLHFHPSVVSILRQGDGNKHSKKDSSLRYTELLSHISPAVIRWVSINCQQLMSDHLKHDLVLSVIAHCNSDVSDAMQAVAHIAAEPFTPHSTDSDVADDDKTSQHIIDHCNGHRVLKRLIYDDVERMKRNEQTALFSTILLDTVPVESLQSWTACNRGCFVLVSLLEINHTEVTSRVCSALAERKSFLDQLNYKGAEILRNKLTAVKHSL